MTPPNILEQTVSMLVKVLKSPGCRRIPVFVETPQHAVDCARFLGDPLTGGSGSGTARLCPIFMVSNVTGHNLPMLRTFLNVLPSAQSDDKYVVDAPFEFQISDVFSVPFVGTVVVSATPVVVLCNSYHSIRAASSPLEPCTVGRILREILSSH
jgi:GTPase